MTPHKGKLFVISAPSGAGKTTLVQGVLEQLQPTYALERVVTYTSRKPRTGEVEGRDYHFLSISDFEHKIKEGFFLEWSVSYGTYYGSPFSLIEQLSLGISYIIILDIKGAIAVQSLYKDTVLIWIYPPQQEELERRLRLRATESSEEIGFRLQLAEKEMVHSSLTKAFKYAFINEELRSSLNILRDIIVKELAE